MRNFCTVNLSIRRCTYVHKQAVLQFYIHILWRIYSLSWPWAMVVSGGVVFQFAREFLKLSFKGLYNRDGRWHKKCRTSFLQCNWFLYYGWPMNHIIWTAWHGNHQIAFAYNWSICHLMVKCSEFSDKLIISNGLMHTDTRIAG